MTQLLIRLFIKNYQNTHNQKVRQKYGMLGGMVGIAMNLLLFAGKFLAGILTSSIAITADAFNNLSDAGSSILMLIGFKMAGRPSDSNHPFGHGRIEYLAGLAVSMAIMLMGIELIRSSLDKILHPEAMVFQWVSMVILLASIAAKVWMCLFNRKLGKVIDSVAMKTTAMDSLSDAIATSVVVIGIAISAVTDLVLDGYLGILVAGFILYTGYHTAKDSLSPLLGQAPDPALVKDIEKTVLVYSEVVGIHDLIIHNYGPGQIMVSLHAEVPCDMDVMSAHDVIDLIELELKKKFDCEATIHMDPIVTNDERILFLRQQISQLVKEIDPRLSIHDFRMTAGPSHKNLIFDVVVPHRFVLDDDEIRQRIRDAVQHWEGGRYYAVVHVDKSYLGEPERH